MEELVEDLPWMIETTYDNQDQCSDFEAEPDADHDHVKPKRRAGRRHKSQWLKQPMALSEIILELQDVELRENALRCLSGHLIERREHDVTYYRTAASMLYYSCSTLAILTQEVISPYEKLYAGDLNVRGSKRLANVLTLFQCIAANGETRIPFVKAHIPNLLLPYILSTYTEEVYENVRAISLSVIDLLCKECEDRVIQWVLDSDIIAACVYAIEIGSRLSKVVLNVNLFSISMSILESILRDKCALAIICEPPCTLAEDVVIILSHLVAVLAVVQDFSPRLVFHVIRSYILLCQHPRTLELVKDRLPQQLQDHTFHDLKKVYPLFRHLQHQLLLNTGKAESYMPGVSPDSETLSTPSTTDNFNKKVPSGGGSSMHSPEPFSNTPERTPLRPLDLNKEEWLSSSRLAPGIQHVY